MNVSELGHKIFGQSAQTPRNRLGLIHPQFFSGGNADGLFVQNTVRRLIVRPDGSIRLLRACSLEAENA